MAIPGLFLFNFLSDNPFVTNFYIELMLKRPFNIRCWYLNSRPRERESFTINTRPVGFSYVQSDAQCLFDRTLVTIMTRQEWQLGGIF